MAAPALKILEPVLRSAAAEGLPAFLDELEAALSEFARSQTGFLGDLTAHVLTGSGKRLRPGLVFVASRLGTADRAAVKEAALALEMIHIATLIHDDLVDDAVLRRRRPTVGVKFGEGAAVLLGDYVYARAFQRLGALGNPEFVRILADTTLTMCEGEIGQYEGRYRFDLTESDYLSFLQKKTASLMAAACQVGARLAGRPEAEVRALEIFGDRLGIAFQLVDDILDIEGDEAVVGKTLRTDLTHGKMTLPLILHAAGLPTDVERRRFFNLLRNPDGDLEAEVRRIRSSGVLELCRRKARALLEEAENALGPIGSGPVKSLLVDIARRLSDRQV